MTPPKVDNDIDQEEMGSKTVTGSLPSEGVSGMTRIFNSLSLPIKSIRQNPVVRKEMRSQMRGNRAFIIITVYLFLLSVLIGLIYLGFISVEETSPNSSIRQVLGKTVFGAVVGLEMMMVVFLSPALTSGSIAAERERLTFDLLRTTLLPAKSLVHGKLISALAFLMILLFVGFPLQSMAFLFGGVSIEEVLIAFLILIATAIFFSSIGLFISSFMKNILASTVVSYIVAILVSFGVPVLITLAIAFFGVLPQAFNNLSNFQQTLIEIIILCIGYLFVVVNPLSTAITTEIMILEEQNAFLVHLPLSNGWDFPIIGPWISYVFLYLLASLILIGLSIRLVRRVEQ